MKIYTPPEAVGPKPEIDYAETDIKKEMAREEAWVQKIVEWAKANGSGPMRGEEVDFPVADGAARYIVLHNSGLIHLPIGDAWSYPYVTRLRVKDIHDLINRQKSLSRIFKVDKEEKNEDN